MQAPLAPVIKKTLVEFRRGLLDGKFVRDQEQTFAAIGAWARERMQNVLGHIEREYARWRKPRMAEKPIKIAMSRRNFVAIAVMALALVDIGGEDYAKAALFRGGGNLIVINPPAISLQFSNLSGSASPSSTNVYWFQLFKQGDIPANQSPVLRYNSISYQLQCDQVFTYGDGSLAGCRISLANLPSIAGSTTASAFIASQNIPIINMPSRTTADITSLGVQVHLTNVKNISGQPEGSGSWTAKVNDAISAGGSQVQVINAGAAQCEWKVIAYFYDDVGGAQHPHLRMEFYGGRWTLADTSAGPAQFRVAIDNGHLQSMTDGFSTYAIATGTTATQSLVGLTSGSPTPITFIVPAGRNFYIGQAISAVMGSAQYMQGTVTSYSGTSLVISMTQKIGFGSATSWNLIPTPSIYTMDASLQTANGSTTIRNITSITCAHHSGFFLSPSSGARDWVEADGTLNARSNIFVRQDATYLVKTDLVPPYDTTLSLALSDSAYVPAAYSPIISGFVTNAGGNPPNDVRSGMGYTNNGASIYQEALWISPGTNTGGDREDLGLWAAWCVRAFLSQGPNYFKTAYIRSLCARTMNLGYRNSTTWRPAVLNNGPNGSGTYSGMGSNYSTSWQASQDFQQIAGTMLGCVGPTGNIPNGWCGTSGINALIDPEHFPSCHFAVYLLCGEWEHLDMAMNDANMAVLTRNPGIGRNIDVTISGTRYRFWGNTCDNGANVRTPAWALALLSQTARYLPDASPEKPYFTELAATHVAAAKWMFTVYYPSFPAYAPCFPSLGIPWFPVTPGGSGYTTCTLHSFMQSYLLMALALDYMLRGDANTLYYGNYIMSWLKGLSDRMPALYFEAYSLGGVELDSTSHNMISSLDRFGFWNTDNNGLNYSALVFTNGSSTVKVMSQTGSWTNPATYPSAPDYQLLEGQPIRITINSALAGGDGPSPTPPPEAPVGTTLYVRNPNITSVQSVVNHQVSTSKTSTNTIQLSLTPTGPILTFSADQTIGCPYVLEIPQGTPIAELPNGGAGLSGPGGYGNLRQTATKMAYWAGFNNAQAVNDNIASVVTTYTNALAANTPSNNPKIIMKYPHAA